MSGKADDRHAGLRRRYLNERAASVPSPARIVVLHIGEDETHIDWRRREDGGPADGTEGSIRLAIGTRRTATDHFQSARHVLPDGLALENAIMAVEDELARARSVVGLDRASLVVVSDDALIGEIARVAGASAASGTSIVTLTRAAVEATFDRLAAVALGRPAEYEKLPVDRAFAAALLILREAMHHLDLPAIEILR